MAKPAIALWLQSTRLVGRVAEFGSFGMRVLLSLVSVTLLVSCGKAPDPAFVSGSGDLGAFLVEAISNRIPMVEVSNQLPSIQTTWHSRVLSDRHKSGEYLEGRQALQVATSTTNFIRVEALFTQRLGPPTLPVRQEPGGWRHVGWARPEQGLGIWLVEDENRCRVEIVTEATRGKP